jgi:putative ABC transport system permease protein
MTARRDTLRLARVMSPRRLRERPLRSALTAAGVAAGVALLFSITLLNAQLKETVHATGALVTGSHLLQVSAASPGGLPETMETEVSADGRVAATAPLLINRTRLSIGRHEVGGFVIGVSGDLASVDPDLLRDLTIESSRAPGAGLVLGHALASRLDVEVGRRVSVSTPARRVEVPVRAIVTAPLLARVDSGMAALQPLRDAQRLFGRVGRIDQIIVAAKPGANVAALEADLARALAGRAIVGAPGSATAGSASDLDAYLLATEAGGLIALVVAAMLVFNTMTMAMAERRTEIALAGALGATRRQLLVATLGEATLLGALGTLAGLVAGGVLARAVVPLASRAYSAVSPVDIPTHVELRLAPILGCAAAGLAVAVVGAFIPALRAARAVPIDALRPNASYEWRDPAHPSRTTAIAVLGLALFLVATAAGLRVASGDLETTQLGFIVVTMLVGLALVLPAGVPLVAGGLAKVLTRLWPGVGRNAGDALRANPRRTSFTVAVLALPLANVVAITAAFGSATTKFDQVAHTFVTAPLNVSADSIVGYTASQPLAPANQATLEAVPGVRAALANQNAFVRVPDGSQGVLYAVPLTAARRAGVPDLIKVDQLSDDPAAFRSGLAHGEIAASRLAARNLHLHVGSDVTLPTFYLDHDTYAARWGDQGARSYSIVTDRGASLPDVHRDLERAVAATDMPAEVQTQDQVIGYLLSSLTNLTSLARGIELATLLCAAGALANTAFTAVAERRWTLGLQQALGMTRRQLTRSLALEALAIGLIGSIAGAAIGLGLAGLITHAMAAISSSHLPHPIPWGALTSSVGLGAGIAALATQYPRRRARRVSIIESLRYE